MLQNPKEAQIQTIDLMCFLRMSLISVTVVLMLARLSRANEITA